jgi:hypothetical protein
LDYSGGATCPRLLLEPQRTNLVLRSEEFDNASWVKGGVTVTANAAISPDGTLDADTIALGAGGFANIRQTIAVANNTSYTVSCYYKNIALTAGQTFEMRYTNELAIPNNLNAVATIDLFAGTVTSAIFGTIVTGYSGSVSSSIANVGNDWYRVTMTFTVGTSGAANGIFRPAVVPTANARTFYAWGAQLEAGAYASSYIPTTTAAVTRLADACSKTGISSLIGQTEGTLFVDTIINGNVNPILMQIINNTSSYTESIYVEYIRASNVISANFYDANVLQATFNTPAVIGTQYKIAAVYKTNDFALYVNGVQIGTDNSGTVQSGLQDLFIGGLKGSSVQDYNGNTLNQALLFTTRLTNAQLAELTSL